MLIRHKNRALFLRLGLPSTLIRHENAALFLRLGLPSTPIRHENGDLFLRLGLPSTLIRHESRAFRKRSSNRTEEFENADFSVIFMWMENTLKTELFENYAVFFKHKSKITDDCCVFKFLQRSVNGKHLMSFEFSELHLDFQIPQAQCPRGLNLICPL